MKEFRYLYKIKVTGRVQGVGFRHACLREARFLGIHGYVKNQPEGSVYIEAEGTTEQLGQLVEWCKRGPGYGTVEDVFVETSPCLTIHHL